jgi:parallel beta-helix repeat protein
MKRASFWCAVVAVAGVFLLSSCGKPAAKDFQKSLQERLITANPGDVIEIPEGKFHVDRTLSLIANGVTIRGKGMDKSILSFTGQKTGAQGVLVKANDFTIEDVAIEDSAGDALTIQGGTNITVRRVRTEWTRGPNEANGPYGIYPVECKQLLVEDSVARGAADAGIYVGQAENVIIRRNRSEFNVDGYEIENSENVDVYENVATHNAGGMGIFNLPNLPRQGGRHVRAFNNQLVDNNTPNFAPKSLGPIYYLPTGTGMYVMAIRDVEVFNNKIQNNNTVNPFVRDVFIHDNDISGGGQSPDSRVPGMTEMATALGGKFPDILYDGMVDPTWGRKGPNQGQVCLSANGTATFLNFDAAGNMKHPVHDVKQYACSLTPITAVTIAQATPAGGN